MNTTRNHRTLTSVVVASAAVFGLAACSSSSSGEASTSASATGESSPSAAVSAADAGTTSNLRDARYCEIIPTVREGVTLTSYVYNTLGFNDCPQDVWSTLTEEGVNEEYGAEATKLNGPRWWTLDAIVGSGESATGETFTFGGPGGIEMGLRATLETKVGEPTVGDQAYVPNEVARDTVFTFNAGEPVFELTDPEGNVYMMQSFTTLEDPSLTFDGLATLGEKLQLPEGWSYSTRVLEEDYNLSTADTGGNAFVVNDDLLNSYQRRAAS